MAKQQASRAAARKIKDKWRAKEWYTVNAPEMFDSKPIGETPADDPQKVQGRIIVVTAQEITGDFSKMHIKLRFKIVGLNGSQARTVFIGHDFTSDYLRRLTRRKRSKTDDVYKVVTKDNYQIRLKPMAVAERRIQASQQTMIRANMKAFLKKDASSKTLSELVRSIISGDIAKQLAVACKAIYPLKKIEIRASEVTRFPDEVMSAPVELESAPEDEEPAPPTGEEEATQPEEAMESDKSVAGEVKEE